MKSTKESVPNGAAELPVPFEITLPNDTPEFMAPAYFGCLHWAVSSSEILDQFKKATGIEFPAARAPITKMVDEACSFDPYADIFRAFVPWFNETIWGVMEGPGEE